MDSQLRISAKTLGSLALPGFCPRCLWIQMHVRKLPYQIFPGIFSTIDSYGKRLVHGWFDEHESAPPWLSDLGKLKGYRKPPHYTKFSVLHRDTSVLLTGTPDGILIREDDSHLIVDYKTAKFTAHQDALLPMYEVQLNAYAYLGENCGYSPVTALALVYTEPITDDVAAKKKKNMTERGFAMDFSAHVLPVKLKPQTIPKLLAKARKICDSATPPSPASGCEDCESLRELLQVALN
jgi:hypothetical protein